MWGKGLGENLKAHLKANLKASEVAKIAVASLLMVSLSSFIACSSKNDGSPAPNNNGLGTPPGAPGGGTPPSPEKAQAMALFIPLLQADLVVDALRPRNEQFGDDLRTLWQESPIVQETLELVTLNCRVSASAEPAEDIEYAGDLYVRPFNSRRNAELPSNRQCRAFIDLEAPTRPAWGIGRQGPFRGTRNFTSRATLKYKSLGAHAENRNFVGEFDLSGGASTTFHYTTPTQVARRTEEDYSGVAKLNGNDVQVTRKVRKETIFNGLTPVSSSRSYIWTVKRGNATTEVIMSLLQNNLQTRAQIKLNNEEISINEFDNMIRRYQSGLDGGNSGSN